MGMPMGQQQPTGGMPMGQQQPNGGMNMGMPMSMPMPMGMPMGQQQPYGGMGMNMPMGGNSCGCGGSGSAPPEPRACMPGE